jgi:hypothetical protein
LISSGIDSTHFVFQVGKIKKHEVPAALQDQGCLPLAYANIGHETFWEPLKNTKMCSGNILATESITHKHLYNY